MYSDILNSFTRSGKPVEDLSRFARLMHTLGDPQDGLVFIHVAGTNGKGSAVRMLSEMLTRAGYRTGEFTSPYIVRYNDRIRIDGKDIPDEDIERILSRIMENVTGDEGYSQFEITNAIAFIWYAEQKCDAVVLEAGMGGLLDSTNIITTGICSVIMSISLDHTSILGETVEKIARQKAGIIKPGCPAVLYAPNPAEAADVVRKAAQSCGSRLIIADTAQIREISVSEDGCEFEYRGKVYTTAMTGRHQIYNAAAVIEAAEVIRERLPDLTDEHIRAGIASARVPSRMQILSHSPLVICDGAHNPDAMRRLAEYVKTLPQSPKVMIYGQMTSKDYVTSAAEIAGYIDMAYCIDDFAPGQGTVKAEDLTALFDNAQAASSADVLDRAKAYAGDGGAVIIAGSLYMRSLINAE